jgi:hypothetical protein
MVHPNGMSRQIVGIGKNNGTSSGLPVIEIAEV